jgi:hypothetical protein
MVGGATTVHFAEIEMVVAIVDDRPHVAEDQPLYPQVGAGFDKHRESEVDSKITV